MHQLRAASQKKSPLWRRRIRTRSLAALGVLSILGLMGCGDRAPSSGDAPGGQTEGRPAEHIERRLEEVRSQLEAVKHQSEALDREMESRLDQLDSAVEGLEFQIQNLETEIRTEAMKNSAASIVEPEKLSAPPTEKIAEPAPKTEASEPPTKEMDAGVKEEQEAEGSREQSSNRTVLTAIFWGLLVLAIFALVWIAFQRYGDAEDGDESPPRKEAHTSLGKIQFPPETEAPETPEESPSPSEDEAPTDDDA